MNFKSFINEEELTNENILNLIKKDCSEFLIDSKGQYLYRGIPNQSDEFIKVVPRSDRKPKNSSLKQQEMFNTAFEKIHNINDIRSRAVFATGRHSDTEVYAYGKLSYIIFPVNGSTFWWSPIYGDVYIDYKDFLRDNDYKYNTLRDEWPEGSMEEFIESAEYTDKDLARGIKSGNEIMILCKEYYGIRTDTKVDLEKLWEEI